MIKDTSENINKGEQLKALKGKNKMDLEPNKPQLVC